MEANTLRRSAGALALNDADVAAEADVSVSDEQLALRAREQFRESGVPAIAPDASIAPHLEPDERLLGARHVAILRKVDVDDDGRAVLREEGPLYITDRRLLHIGGRVQAIDLLDIDELAMADDRILVTLVGSRGLTLDVDQPHQLRVLIAAAKAALRLHAGG